MVADVDNDAVANYLAGNAGSSSARYEVGVTAASLINKFYDVVLIFRIGNTERQLAVYRSICGVGYAVQTIGEDLHRS